jgi:hypothetical protein
MGSAAFVLDSDHVFRGSQVYAALREWDGQFWASPEGPVPGLLMRVGEYLRTWEPDHGLTMIVEESAVDEEYFREFLDCYAATFWENPPTVRRLHFFAANAPDVLPLLDPAAQAPSPGQLEVLKYLGYLVLRRTHPRTVGEMILQAPRYIGGHRCYVACKTRFGQTVCGRRVGVDAVPCIGQDQTGVCAHSAVWGALKYLHKYRYYPKMSLPELALRAGRLYPSTELTRPAGGLFPEAIYVLLRDLGACPIRS